LRKYYMNSLFTQKIGSAACAVLFGLAIVSPSPTVASPPMRPQSVVNPAWVSDASLVATLGPEVAVAGYRMRLPVGYTADLKKDQTEGAMKAKFFSLHRADNMPATFVPTMFVMALSFPPSDVPSTAAQVMDGDGYIHGKPGLVKNSPQAGRVNGLKAVRQYFKFLGADGHERHGFHYVVMDGAKRSLIVVMDEEPYSKTSLPLAEASVLTVRK